MQRLVLTAWIISVDPGVNEPVNGLAMSPRCEVSEVSELMDPTAGFDDNALARLVAWPQQTTNFAVSMPQWRKRSGQTRTRGQLNAIVQTYVNADDMKALKKCGRKTSNEGRLLEHIKAALKVHVSKLEAISDDRYQVCFFE